MRSDSKRAEIIRFIAFFLIFIILFIYVDQIVARKSLSNPHNDTVKIGGFHNEPQNTFDVITFGSSHAYCTVNPLVMWRDAGIPSYVFSSEGQPIDATYYYIKEALKTQSPKVAVIELYMLTSSKEYPEEMAAHDAVDYLPLSENKIDLINTIVPHDMRINYYFNFMKYHSRWQALSSQDFDMHFKKDVDIFRGYAFIKERNRDIVSNGVYNTAAPVEISDKNLEYLQKIVQLSQERHFNLVFLVAPFMPNAREAGIFKSIRSFADQNQVAMLDMNRMYKELNFYEPGLFCDGNHLNCYGSEKVSSYLAGYLKEKFDLADKRSDSCYSTWNSDLPYYAEQMSTFNNLPS